MKVQERKIQGFILYRIYYDDWIAYLGRTKQPLQSRIRGHLFQKPMHRTIYIEQVSKIEYAEFKTESDMNLYEVYFINLWKPPLNVDDKCKDDLTVQLPPVEWKVFNTKLWEKWKEEIEKKEQRFIMRKQEKRAQEELLMRKRRDFQAGKILENEYYSFKDNME
jgi:hypothetical protein